MTRRSGSPRLLSTTKAVRLHMRRVGLWIALLAVFAALAPLAGAQNFGLRTLNGKVLGAQDAPINGAIVYLENSRNNDIKSYISEKDGTYHFADLSSDTDYTLWASFKGKKSSTKTISSFDTRKQVYIDLHVKE